MEASRASSLGTPERESIEITYWRDSPTERPGAESLDNLLNKMGDARIFLIYLRALRQRLVAQGTVLELGAGQGWASCIYKQLHPAARVIATDLSVFAVESIDYWHRVFGVQTDRHYACKSYATAEPDESVDLVYCFAAAHHFAETGRTLGEIRRILRPGARAMFLHEPVVGRLLYPLAYRRVNAVREAVPEDLLIVRDMERLAASEGFDLEVLNNERLVGAAVFPTLSYRLQRLVPFLANVLPSSASFIFTKR